MSSVMCEDCEQYKSKRHTQVKWANCDINVETYRSSGICLLAGKPACLEKRLWWWAVPALEFEHFLKKRENVRNPLVGSAHPTRPRGRYAYPLPYLKRLQGWAVPTLRLASLRKVGGAHPTARCKPTRRQSGPGPAASSRRGVRRPAGPDRPVSGGHATGPWRR
jgi:hypothetical protein